MKHLVERRTVFFSSEDSKLSAFARQVVDIEDSTIKGHPVVFEPLMVNVPKGRHKFWVVKTISDELRGMLLQNTDFAVQGDTFYSTAEPRHDGSLKFWRQAEDLARAILFPERYNPALAAQLASAR